jgi:hypothetical protein
MRVECRGHLELDINEREQLLEVASEDRITVTHD